MSQKNFKYALIISIAVAIIEAYLLFKATTVTSEYNKELERSKGRVELLEQQVSALDSSYTDLEVQKQQLDSLLEVKPKERIVIINDYDEKINNVYSLELDSSIRFIAGRLSEIKPN